MVVIGGLVALGLFSSMITLPFPIARAASIQTIPKIPDAMNYKK